MKKLIVAALALVVIVAAGTAVAIRVLLAPDRVRSALESQASAAIGMPVRIGSATAHIWPRPGIAVADVTIGEPALVTLAHARVSTGLRPLLSRRVEDAEVTIKDSQVDLAMVLGALGAASRVREAKGGEDGSEGGGATSTAPALTIVNVRSIGLENVVLAAGERRATVTLESALNGDTLEIRRLSAQAEGTRLEATGAVDSIAARRAHLSIKADPLDLDGLMQFASVFSQPPAGGGAARIPAGAAASSPGASAASAQADEGGTGTAMDLRADVEAPSGRAAGLTFTDMHAVIAVTPGTVTLNPVTLTALGGRLEGEMSMRLADVAPTFEMRGRVSGASLQQVAQFAGGAPSTITGTLDATAVLDGRGLDAAAAMGSATGTAEVSLSDGTLPGLQLVRPAVLAFGRPEGAPPEGRGEAFDRITATVNVGDGRLRTDDLTFQSRDVDMDGTGTLALAGGDLDVKANLRLSEELSAQAGRDLVRYAHEGDRVVLPATVSGTVDAPFVMIDAKRALGRAVTNELRDRAKSALDRLLPGRKKPPQ